MKLKLKIVSDGSSSRVVNAETGEAVLGVKSVEWQHHAGKTPTAIVTIIQPSVELLAAVNEVEKEFYDGGSVSQIVLTCRGYAA